MDKKIISKKVVLSTIPFQVEEMVFKKGPEAKTSHPYHRLLCPNWVNVFPLTKEGKVVLIKQPRVGAFSDILETPGGVVERGEDPKDTAIRELEEETGYFAEKLIKLMSINPNPAIMNNEITFFVGINCELKKNRERFPDKDEKIDLCLVDPKEVDDLVLSGKINHSLAALCILLAQKYLDLEKNKE